MPVISETKKNQICDELTRHGVQPNEAAIANVIDIMKADQRVSIKTACKRLAETQGQNHATQNRNQTRVSQGASIQSKVLDDAARGLATQMKKVIGAKAIDYLMEDLAAGDLGEYFDQSLSEAFGTFGAILDAEYVAIAGGSPSPLLLESVTSAGDIE